MARRGGGFGIVILVVVMAIVLLLVAQAWKQVAPAALDVNRATTSGPIPAHGQEAAAQQLRSGQLPKLTDMHERTDTHTEQVQAAIAESQ